MQIMRLKEARIKAQRATARLDQGQSRLRALAHHIAQLACQNKLTFAWHGRGLHMQDLAAYRCPRQARGDAGHRRARALFVGMRRRTQDGGQIRGTNHSLARFAFGYTRGHMAHDGANPSFQLPHTGFAHPTFQNRRESAVLDLTTLAI